MTEKQADIHIGQGTDKIAGGKHINGNAERQTDKPADSREANG